MTPNENNPTLPTQAARHQMMVINLHIKQSHTNKLEPGALHESSAPPVRPNNASRRQTSTLNWDDCRVPAWGRFTPRKRPGDTHWIWDLTEPRIGQETVVAQRKISRLVQNLILDSSSMLITYCSIIRAGCFKELAQLRMFGLYICILSARIGVNSEVGRTSRDPVVAFFKVVKAKW